MIDTDKYEGHTPGRWMPWGSSSLITIEVVFAQGAEKAVICKGLNERDARLIADAPLLLAEVKRLRAYIDKLYAKDPGFVDSIWEEGDPTSRGD